LVADGEAVGIAQIECDRGDSRLAVLEPQYDPEQAGDLKPVRGDWEASTQETAAQRPTRKIHSAGDRRDRAKLSREVDDASENMSRVTVDC
jgi:hypothetical protein